LYVVTNHVKDVAFVSQKLLPATRNVESPWKTFSHGPSGNKIFKFCFLKRHVLVYFIFFSDSGASKRRGARDNLPPSHPLRSTGLPVTDVLAAWTANPPLKLSGPDRR